ncbi:hypothetical protein LSAT2_023749 [Lamellibrachia satsuma]|nr:hypothetical protein LSAT2_023749 [Lamellibrachia satsuma]
MHSGVEGMHALHIYNNDAAMWQGGDNYLSNHSEKHNCSGSGPVRTPKTYRRRDSAPLTDFVKRTFGITVVPHGKPIEDNVSIIATTRPKSVLNVVELITRDSRSHTVDTPSKIVQRCRNEHCTTYFRLKCVRPTRNVTSLTDILNGTVLCSVRSFVVFTRNGVGCRRDDRVRKSTRQLVVELDKMERVRLDSMLSYDRFLQFNRFNTTRKSQSAGNKRMSRSRRRVNAASHSVTYPVLDQPCVSSRPQATVFSRASLPRRAAKRNAVAL